MDTCLSRCMFVCGYKYQNGQGHVRSRIDCSIFPWHTLVPHQRRLYCIALTEMLLIAARRPHALKSEVALSTRQATQLCDGAYRWESAFPINVLSENRRVLFSSALLSESVMCWLHFKYCGFKASKRVCSHLSLRLCVNGDDLPYIIIPLFHFYNTMP